MKNSQIPEIRTDSVTQGGTKPQPSPDATAMANFTCSVLAALIIGIIALSVAFAVAYRLFCVISQVCM